MILPICLIIFGVCAIGVSILNFINLAMEMWKIQTSVLLRTNQGVHVDSFKLTVSNIACFFMTFLPAAGLASIIVGAVLLV